jgi:hypothetical protein
VLDDLTHPPIRPSARDGTQSVSWWPDGLPSWIEAVAAASDGRGSPAPRHAV